MPSASDRLATADVVWGANVRRRERGFERELEEEIVAPAQKLAFRAVHPNTKVDNVSLAAREVADLLREAGRMVEAEMIGSARAEERHLRRSMMEFSEVGWTEVPDDLLELVGRAERFEGATVREWSNRLGVQAQAQIRTARGQADARELATKAVGEVRNGVRFLAANFVYRATAYARELSWQVNRSRLRGVVWLSVLDERTTPHVCIPRAWKRYSLPNFEPIGHDRPWLSGPGRSHVRCRARAVMAPRNAPWPRSMSGEKWLREQPRSVQEEILGKRRVTLWRSKKYTLNQMIDGDHESMKSVAELDAAGVRAVQVAGQ